MDGSDFSLSGVASGVINTVTKIDNKTYDVLINSISGAGSLQLNIKGVNGVSGTNDIAELVINDVATINQTQTDDYLNQSKIGQTFTATTSNLLSRVTFYPKAGNHTFEGTAILRVYDGDETNGGIEISSEQVTITDNADAAGQTFEFITPQNLTLGNTYSIVLSDFSGSGAYALEANMTETYTGGHAIFTNQTVAHDAFDLKITIYEGFEGAGQSLETIAPTIHEHYIIEDVLNVENFQLTSVDVYPNPVDDILTISAKQPISNILIIDIFGKKVYEEVYNSKTIKVPFNNFKTGLYIIKIQSDSDFIMKKVLKKG